MSLQPIYMNMNGKKERCVIVRTRSQDARGAVSRENRQEYDNEKRAKELARRMPSGSREAVSVAVAKMMSIPEAHARRLVMKKNQKVVLDGKID